MSIKTRLKRLEKEKINNRLWAFIGIGKPRNSQHQHMLEIQARNNFYASGGDKMLIWLSYLLILLALASLVIWLKAS